MQDDPFFVGVYQIEKQIRHSAYSVLGLGKKLETGLPVLLRLWFTAHATTTAAQKRIQMEVAALQQIQHPHLMPLLEVGASAQGIFLVSVQASFGSLHDRLHQSFLKPLPFEEALQLIQQVGQGLHALHQQGITHGNLTPHAIFFNEPGHARLGEFRMHSILACIEHYQPALDEGVPHCWYMAPEQFHGVSSAQSDQYALGCLAYLLLTGQVPFTGSARATLLQKHQRDQPLPLTEYNPAISRHVEAALLKALAKHPAERYSSVQAFLEALEYPQRTVLAEQAMLAHAFGTALVNQERGEQLPFDVVCEAAASAMPEEVACVAAEEPVTAAPWTRTRVSGVTPVVLVPPAGKRQPARRSFRARGRFVLSSMVLLVRVIVCAAGRWLSFRISLCSYPPSEHEAGEKDALPGTKGSASE